MKLLILIGNSEFVNKAKCNELSTNNITGYSTVYAYYIIKYLKNYPNIELVYSNVVGSANKDIIWNKDNLGQYIPEADHCIAFEQRAFFNRHISYFYEIRKKITGKITTICDNNYNIGPEDCTFYSVGWIDNRVIPKSLYVGWAASQEECYIDKDDHKISILIDHSYYGAETPYVPDYSKLIIPDVCQFAQKNRDTTIVRRFVSGGVETLDIDKPWYEIYNRNGVSFKEACQEYNKAHIFIVTHEESLGLSVIEAAMSGALILVPNNPKGRGSCIKHWLIKPLNHVMFDPSKGIPWKKIISNLNIKNNRKKALPFNYENVTKKMVNYLLN